MKAETRITAYRSFENYRDILLVLLQKEIKVRYADKALGYIWSIANPLASAFVYYIAFGIMMRIKADNYVLMLIAGLFPWQWMSNCVGAAPRMFVGNSLIRKLSFPRVIIPLAAILNHMIHFLLSLPVILVFMFIYKQTPPILSWFYGIPILAVIQLIMVLGLTLALSSLNLFFRDMERLVSILLHFTFYLTPILYTEDMIPDQYKHFMFLNPFAPLMVSWRNLFLEGTMNPLYLLISLVYALIFFGIGYWIYNKLSWKFAEVV